MSTKPTWIFETIVPCLRQDVFAVSFWDGKKVSYKPVKRPITLKDVEFHVGRQDRTDCLGQYLILEDGGNTVRAAVIDIDDKKKELTWEEMCDAATRLSAALVTERLFTYPVRSGGGAGIHLWVFWRDPQRACDVRAALFRAFERLDGDVSKSSLQRKLVVGDKQISYDVYPTQDSIEQGGGFGNLVALPFARASAPLNVSTFEVLDEAPGIPYSPPVREAVDSALESAMLESADAGFENVVYDQMDIDRLKDALTHVPADEYGTWSRVGMALKLAGEEGTIGEDEAYQIFMGWSQTSPDKFDAKNFDNYWKSFKNTRSNKVTIGTIVYWAKENGWAPPRATVIQAKKEAVAQGALPLAEAPTLLTQESDELDPDAPSEFQELNARYFFVMDEGKARIMHESFDYELRRPKLVSMSPPDFQYKYQNREIAVRVYGKNGKPVSKMENLAKAWLTSLYRRQYEAIVFDPKKTAPKGYYNLWRGFAVTPAEGDWSLLKAHMLENLCNGDQEHYTYLLRWMAYTVQNPDTPIGVSIVLKGERGTGKGSLVTPFGRLFGHHYMQVTSTRQVTGNFNAHLRDCIVLFADEAVWAGNRAEESVIKGIVTEPYLTIEGKGKDSMTCRNMVHMMVATNNEWAIPAGLDERRFFVLNVSNQHKQDLPYFTAIRIQMAECGGQAAMLHELQNMDLTAFVPMNVPRTEALLEQKMQSLDPAIQWWHRCLERGYIIETRDWAEQTPLDLIYEDYIAFSKSINSRHIVSEMKLRLAISGRVLPPDMPRVTRKFAPGRVRHFSDGTSATKNERRIHWQFPGLDACRALFERVAGHKIEWPEIVELDDGDNFE